MLRLFQAAPLERQKSWIQFMSAQARHPSIHRTSIPAPSQCIPQELAMMMEFYPAMEISGFHNSPSIVLGIGVRKCCLWQKFLHPQCLHHIRRFASRPTPALLAEPRPTRLLRYSYAARVKPFIRTIPVPALYHITISDAATCTIIFVSFLFFFVLFYAVHTLSALFLFCLM